MNVLLSASKMMTAGEANQLIKQSLRNKEELALADLQAKQTIEQIKKDKKDSQPIQLTTKTLKQSYH